ncbi:unnamed protein product [Orchesella dallaii]|uniref:BTB domain-containing protein n=1 Tax=Orchesella dallaii TaxID=48710 RepID=A0ABP1RXQ9_9HEXA
MVLLTYQSAPPTCNGKGEKEPVENETDKSDGPKTAYIDKLYKFKDENAYEEKCDLFFICHDGEVPAHRLVISNASKYIMAMQNDQPPWYPVYISVPDLNTEIVQTLVQLAYTGQMNIPPSTTSDDLLDAMQALGWVHTDALTATYTDSANPLNDEDVGSPLNKSRDSVETIIKLNFPSNPKPEADTSEDEGGMEIDVPDLPMSDEDDSKVENNVATDTKKGAGRRPNRRITKPAVSKQDTPKSNNVKKKKPVSESPTIEPPVTPAKAETRRRGGRKNVEDETDGVTNSQVSTEAPSSAASSPEAVRSRTRTIRKPKKFEDSIVLTPTKRKDSPTKSPTKSSTNDSKSKAQSEELSNNLTPRRNATNKALKPAEKAKNAAPAAPSTSRTRRSTSASSESKDTPKNSLITSYFTKRSPRRSDDFSPSGSTDETKVENHEKPTEKEKVQNSEVQDTSSSRVRRTASKDTKKMEDVTAEDSGNTATLRKRAKSTASNKSEKDTIQEESKQGGSTETTNKTLPRRKRNFQESSDSTAADGTMNPTRRGRRTSTISTASSKGRMRIF